MAELYSLVTLKGSKIIVWETTENTTFFENNLTLTDVESELLKNLHSEWRRREWLACRWLLKNKFDINNAFSSYNELGKPILLDHPQLSVSFSHTKNQVAVLVTKKCEPLFAGVDVQVLEEKVLKIVPKFLSRPEQQLVEQAADAVFLATLFWAAKEVMFKMAHFSGIIFSEQLTIKELHPNKSILIGVIHGTETNFEVQLCYRQIKNVILVYSV